MRLKADAVSWAATEDDAIVVLDLRTSRYLSLNAAGSVLWQRLADSASEAELQGALVERFHVSQDTAVADVGAFLTKLRERDLLDES